MITRSLVKLVLTLLVSALLVIGVVRLWQQRHAPQVEVMTGAAVLQRIQQLNRLETVAYHIDTVVSSHKDGNWQMLWQDQQKGLFLVSGRVVAGLDLSRLTAQQVQVSADGQQIHISLPPVQILSNQFEKIDVYDIQTGLFGLMDIDPAIFSQAQAVAKQKILASACQSGILQTANDNAQKQIQTLFALTRAQVTVTAAPVPACPAA